MNEAPPFRQAEGFVNSIIALMVLDLSSPDHTTVSRRSKRLKPLLNARISPGEPLHVVVDSRGLSIHGVLLWGGMNQHFMKYAPGIWVKQFLSTNATATRQGGGFNSHRLHHPFFCVPKQAGSASDHAFERR
jgi:hypothetical protein